MKDQAVKSIVITGLAALALAVSVTGCGGGGGEAHETLAADENNVAACNELAADFYSGDTAAKMERWTDLGCEELEQAGQLNSSSSESSVSQEVADSWPEKWCNEVQVGMTLDEAADIMGEPTERFTDQESWYAYQWGFSAFVGSDGRIHQLDWNGVSLNEADRARLTCEETRR